MSELRGRDALVIAIGALIVGAVYQTFADAPVVDFEQGQVGVYVAGAFVLLLVGGGALSFLNPW